MQKGLVQPNVRKIQFAKNNPVPVPDPVLLLAKATSNWLKLQNLVVLPGCSNDNSTSDSHVGCIYCAEAATLGSSTGTGTHKKLRVDEISFVPRDTFDESLSGDEDF